MGSRLQDKVAVVTGAGNGIGKAIATTFGREGAKVIVSDIAEGDAKQVAADIVEAGGTAEAVRTDVTVAEDIEALIQLAVDRFGRIDVLQNNAQHTTGGRIGELSLDGFRAGIDGGLTSYWYASKLAIAHMLEQGGGAIVNTASVSGLAGDYMLGTYNLAKAGVVNLTRVIGIEYARKGIRCNAVCPGPVASKGIETFRQAAPERAAKVADAIPMGRFGETQEIANVCLFLASDEASFVTGAFFVADGGLWAHSGMPALSGVGSDW